MKLLEFKLLTKDNTTCYDPIDLYVKDPRFVILSSAQEIIDNNFVVEIILTYKENFEEVDIHVGHHDVVSIMTWLEQTYPALHEQLPKFNVEEFAQLADQIKSSSQLDYVVLQNGEEFESKFFNDPEVDDFVPVLATVKESIDKINKNGFYTSIQCYPYSPIGFFNFYGTDFQSLLDHVNED